MQLARQALPFQTRRPRREDIPLVARTWVEGSRSSASWCPDKEHDALYRRALDAVLHRATGAEVRADGEPLRPGGSDLWVVPNPEADDRIWAWACADVQGQWKALHWIWVRDEWRKWGLATRLVASILQHAGSRLLWTSWSRMGALLVAGRPEVFEPQPHGYRPDLFRP
jgi:GNAT superfamily N-acetyltransferase